VTLRKAAADARKELRIAILGSGFMGRCHSNAFKKIPFIYASAAFRPRLLILGGRDEEKLKRMATRYGFEEYSTDWHDLVEDERIDVFDNCAPDPVHVEPCLAALKNAKNVICEKPLALSVEDAKRMRDAAARAPGRALCVFNYRFVPAVRFARELIDSGRIGRIYQIRVSYLQMDGHDPALPPERVWYSAWPHSGVLQGIGSHAIDQCRYLAGEVKSVSALVRTFSGERALPSAGGRGAVADEAAAAVLELENGAIGILESSGVATGRKNFLSWEVNGSKGSLRWDLEHPNSLFACLTGSGGRSLDGFTEISVTGPEHRQGEVRPAEPRRPHGQGLGRLGEGERPRGGQVPPGPLGEGAAVVAPDRRPVLPRHLRARSGRAGGARGDTRGLRPADPHPASYGGGPPLPSSLRPTGPLR
jgi:predicted dehydrogenase